MPRVGRELLLVSVAFGLALVLLSLTGDVAKPEGLGAFTWGWPVPWHTTEDMMVGGTSVFGFFLGNVLWIRFLEDLLFWMTIAVSGVEVAWRFGVPWMARLLRTHRWRRVTTVSRAPEHT